MIGIHEPQRCQLSKTVVRDLARRHPWIFRSKLAPSVVEAFVPGQFLRLEDTQGAVVGHGVLEHEGIIGIRILSFGPKGLTLEGLRKTLQDAYRRRGNLSRYTDSFRILNGENDGMPGVVIDVYGGKVLVLQTFSRAMDTLGRWAVSWMARELGVQHVLWKPPTRRKDRLPLRWLTQATRMPVHMREGKLRLWADLVDGQKSGSYLDLRGLRKWVSQQKLQGKRILNLFSYTGSLGVAAHAAGAREVWHVDSSGPALELGMRYHGGPRDQWIPVDIFEWIREQPGEPFDLVIVDPPNMTYNARDTAKVLNTYRRLYRSVLPWVSRRGTLVVCCCTSRIARNNFRRNAESAIGNWFRSSYEIPPESDHPVAFPEGDYLKIAVFCDRLAEELQMGKGMANQYNLLKEDAIVL